MAFASCPWLQARPIIGRVAISTHVTDLSNRIQQLAHEWRLVVEHSFQTETSVISFVTRDGEDLVLKLVKYEGDEWYAGRVLRAFNGHGVVRVHEYTGGAMLIDRLRPGNNLVELALRGHDEEATNILCAVISKMSAAKAGAAVVQGCATVEDWGEAFPRYLASHDQRIPRDLFAAARSVFANLCGSQSRRRLLHGDLQHYNVLFDSQRGWLAIDPKGVIGELEYEIGAVLRNPLERADLFLSRSTIERRLDQFTSKLNLNRKRVLAWAFSQAVLSAIWDIEDGLDVNESSPALRLADVIRPMLPASAIGM